MEQFDAELIRSADQLERFDYSMLANDSTPQPPPTISLRQRTASGVMWVVVQVLLSKGVGLIQQVALAWLLAKEDFGEIGLAYTVTAFVALMANPGIDAVLIQRQRQFRHWATPAFWLGMATGLLGMFVMVAAAPVAAWAYRTPTLIGLLSVLAIATPLQTLQIVPRAQLQIQLHFRAVMLLGLLGNVLTAILTIAGAALEMGAYSFVLPVPISAALVAAASWWVTRPPVKLRPCFSRWKYLLGDGTIVGGTRVMQTIVNRGDYMVLGLLLFTKPQIGTYFFAYNLATQAFRLISGSVGVVLFPSLSKLSHDPDVQRRATMRASRLLAVVAVPFCLLQVVLAGPVFHLFCPPRWADAVLPYQILTIGVMVNAPTWPSASLMMSQRRFREMFDVSVVYGIVFFLTILSAVLIHRSIVSMALAVTLWYLWCSPYIYWAAVRPHIPFHGFFIETYRALVAGVATAVPCALLLYAMPAGQVADAAAIVLIPALFVPLYLLLLRQLMPKDFKDLFAQLTPMLGRFRWHRSPLPPDSA